MSKTRHLVYCHRGGKTPVDNQMSEAEKAHLGLVFLLKTNFNDSSEAKIIHAHVYFVACDQ